MANRDQPDGSELSPERRAAEERSFFGRRKAQKLRARKQGLYADLLPRLILDPAAPPPENMASLFGQSFASCRMEIGFGGGEYLARKAEQNPDTGYIGVEPFINGMAKMLGEIEDRSLANVRLYDDDAALLLDWLPSSSLDQIDLLYPDPWPKKRHWKRRFVNRKNLDRFARVLKPGGEFRFASDIDTYINWTLQHILSHGGFDWTAKEARDWHHPWPDWHRTRYEAKAIREGRTPAYLVFKNTA